MEDSRISTEAQHVIFNRTFNISWKLALIIFQVKSNNLQTKAHLKNFRRWSLFFINNSSIVTVLQANQNKLVPRSFFLQLFQNKSLRTSVTVFTGLISFLSFYYQCHSIEEKIKQ